MKSKKKSKKAQLMNCCTSMSEIENFKKRVEEAIEELRNQREEDNESKPTKKEHSE